MKKYILGLLVIVIIFSGATVFAQERIHVFINGTQLQTSTEPIVEKGSTLVPMRSIFEALGVPLHWDKATQTVSGNQEGKEIKLTIGNSVAYVNGRAVSLAVPAKVINGNTLVPLRFVAEALGSTVEWRASIRSVLISTGNYVYSDSFEVPITFYAVEGKGQYAGYMQLKGHPEEDKYEIYFQGSQSSFHVKSVDIRNINMNEKIKWTYNGKSYVSTKKELHSFFVDSLKLNNFVGTNYTFTDQWYSDTFGDVYTEWLVGFAIENDAARWVQQYFAQLNGDYGNETVNHSSLDEDFEYEQKEQETIFIKEKEVITSTYHKDSNWLAQEYLPFWAVKAVKEDDRIVFYNTKAQDKIVYVLEDVPNELEIDVEYERNDVRFVRDGYNKLYFHIEDLRAVGLYYEM